MFDRKRGHQSIRWTWLHVELRVDKFWIHRDGTQDDIVNDLMS
ncbi:MAG: XisI protein [Akkermansiaceae bacterium]|nr:XisI protein [Armatimonadota bacterium]